MVSIFGMIQEYDFFKKKCRIWKNLHNLEFSLLFNNNKQRTCDILGQLCVFLITICKIFYSKKNFIWKSEKWLKNDL